METALPLATRTFCWGVLHAIGMFDPAGLTNEEKVQDMAEFRTWFCFGETSMAALLAANIAQDAIGAEDNSLILFDDAGRHPLPRGPKLQQARALVRHIATLYGSRS